MIERPIRAVISKVGLDGHDRGAKVIAQAFRDAGMEVIYTGLRRSPAELAAIVLDEDADVLGLSILSGAVEPLTERSVKAMRAAGLDDVVVVVGGIISHEVAERLRDAGIDGAFGPGSSTREIVSFVKQQVAQKRPRVG